MKNKVTVVGSYNVGLFLKGSCIPGVGQTIIGDEFYEGGGGKGSNQAVAAAKMGADVCFVGRIGTDKYGQDALSMYDSFGMNKDYMIVDDTTHTGISVILIDEAGNNSIMVIPGANFNLSKEDIDKSMSVFQDSAIIGFQLENKLEIVDYAIRKASETDAMVLLDPAPVEKLADDLYQHIDIIKPNEHEAAMLTGMEVKDQEDAMKAGQWFIDRGVQKAIITLGHQGVVLVQQDSYQVFDSVKVDSLDSTGAGDCFSGTLMAGLANGASIEEAIKTANIAAAFSVTRRGVVDAIPNVNELNEFIATQKLNLK